MTVRNTNLGGSDWGDEGVVTVDLNDTVDAVVTHRKVFVEATEDTHTGDTDWTDVTDGDFTVTTALNALVTGIRFRCDLKTSDAANGVGVRLKITGTNIGTVYLNSNSGAYAGFMHNGGDTDSAGYDIDTTDAGLFMNTDTSYRTHTLGFLTALKLLDATTTFTIQFWVDNGTKTVSIQNMAVDVVYTSLFSED